MTTDDMPPGPPVPERLSAMGLLAQSWRFVNEHEVMTRASAIAFTSITASVPLLAVVLFVLVQLLPDFTGINPPGAEHTSLGALMLEQMQHALQSMFPPEAYKVVEEQIARMQEHPPVGLLSISVGIMLWCASGVYRGIIDALNHIYGVTENRSWWRVWLLSIWMTLVQTGILIGALLVIIGSPYLVAKVGLDPHSWLWTVGMRWTVVVTVVMVSFALIFHLGPDVRQKHSWVTPGSVLGTILFLGTCYVLKLYVTNFAHYDKTYGSLGGVMTLLLWFYVNSLVLLLAAEVNRLCEFAATHCRLRKRG